MTPATGVGDALGSLAKGQRTRQTILTAAVDLASTEGLEGLTIGRLAEALEMSKSGLFAHFGSKRELQLATLEAARQVFVEQVVRPSLARERGIGRLWGLCEAWLGYAERSVFRGGCFFAAASAEFDGRPGAVRDRIAAILKEWLSALERAGREAQRAGHLGAEADPAQLAFELHALAMGANWAYQLFGDAGAFTRARSAMLARVRADAT